MPRKLPFVPMQMRRAWNLADIITNLLVLFFGVGAIIYYNSSSFKAKGWEPLVVAFVLFSIADFALRPYRSKRKDGAVRTVLSIRRAIKACEAAGDNALAQDIAKVAREHGIKKLTIEIPQEMDLRTLKKPSTICDAIRDSLTKAVNSSTLPEQSGLLERAIVWLLGFG